jgi:uncharacterized membrane protein
MNLLLSGIALMVGYALAFYFLRRRTGIAAMAVVGVVLFAGYGGVLSWKLGTRGSRDGAVAYSDWALGDYLDKAKACGLLDHTVVLIVGDHGARVYGRQDIPAQSYRIPALFLTPEPRWKGQRIERLSSQIDLAPTLLSLAGVAYQAPFLGQDLLGLPPDGGRAFLNHNRDIGMLSDRILVVLGLQKRITYYRRSGRDSIDFEPVADDDVDDGMRALARQASAVYQSTYELYEGRRYVLPQGLKAPAPVAEQP